MFIRSPLIRFKAQNTLQNKLILFKYRRESFMLAQPPVVLLPAAHMNELWEFMKFMSYVAVPFIFERNFIMAEKRNTFIVVINILFFHLFSFEYFMTQIPEIVPPLLSSTNRNFN
jgi:hypothetical protein